VSRGTFYVPLLFFDFFVPMLKRMQWSSASCPRLTNYANAMKLSQHTGYREASYPRIDKATSYW